MTLAHTDIRNCFVLVFFHSHKWPAAVDGVIWRWLRHGNGYGHCNLWLNECSFMLYGTINWRVCRMDMRRWDERRLATAEPRWNMVRTVSEMCVSHFFLEGGVLLEIINSSTELCLWTLWLTCHRVVPKHVKWAQGAEGESVVVLSSC